MSRASHNIGRNLPEGFDEPILNRGCLGIPATESEVRRGYFMYLCDLVGLNGWDNNMQVDMKNGHMTYFLLANALHSKDFIPIIPNDDNRAAWGMQLRKNYALYSSAFEDYSSIERPFCSFLEMFVALAINIDMDIMCSPDDDLDRSKDWFWVMMHNLGFGKYTDANWDGKACTYVNQKLDDLNKRRIGEDGSGGIFPLKNPQKDQRITEIWYQMNAFFIENYDELDLIGRKFGNPPRDFEIF